MVSSMVFICALASLLFSSVTGFGIAPASRSARFGVSTTLSAIRCENKYYQLEELEDQESSTTELYLNYDRSVRFGDTDGPVYKEAQGSWEVKEGTDDFKMTIVREYDVGNSNVGAVSYKVLRVFTGTMTLVGESVGITGVMKQIDTDGFEPEREVGFFNMIDATNERVQE